MGRLLLLSVDMRCRCSSFGYPVFFLFLFLGSPLRSQPFFSTDAEVLNALQTEVARSEAFSPATATSGIHALSYARVLANFIRAYPVQKRIISQLAAPPQRLPSQERVSDVISSIPETLLKEQDRANLTSALRSAGGNARGSGEALHLAAQAIAEQYDIPLAKSLYPEPSRLDLKLRSSGSPMASGSGLLDEIRLPLDRQKARSSKAFTPSKNLSSVVAGSKTEKESQFDSNLFQRLGIE